MRIALFALGITIVLGGCASSGTAAADQRATATSTRPRTNVISVQEIRENGTAPSLADLIRQLRPGWPTNVTVFMNNDPFGAYDSLRNISINNASEIRYLTASEAQMKWGSRFREVIQVITR